MTADCPMATSASRCRCLEKCQQPQYGQHRRPNTSRTGPESRLQQTGWGFADVREQWSAASAARQVPHNAQTKRGSVAG
ncbi:hypothetical protein PR003_g32791 [Phytophthora rubi]|uniref:Uncharacterized protein n=1 Tax=Phytophthora rubi TaxID=129364 RepID=A0A6A3GA21_9STRA|nr:hypothetical protein PR002_g32318 [Phytophthora rubi]KAE9019488.1 hypothetical protein PR002_g12806 [Phytophthora rubi]KAE9260474.1 hypothetical protein PR003_g34353 [Phytophthora rubi]KAE9264478.1 hypothetical protein PR003_g32791 [Phytophthora rubi]